MKHDKELLKGSTYLLLLKLLEKEDMYGYKIITELEKKSENIFELKEGTIYPILRSMENDGLLNSYIESTESLRKRKYYSITKKGKKVLEEKERQWKLFERGVNRVIGNEGI